MGGSGRLDSHEGRAHVFAVDPFDHHDHLVAGLQDGIAVGDEQIGIFAIDCDHDARARQSDVDDALAVGRRVVGNAELDEFERAVFEARDDGELGIDLIVFSRSIDSKMALFLGLLTRAMQRAVERFFAIKQITRLSSSSPVSATTTSARLMPA